MDFDKLVSEARKKLPPVSEFDGLIIRIPMIEDNAVLSNFSFEGVIIVEFEKEVIGGVVVGWKLVE